MTDASDVTGMVTDIQRFSIHDGPGIRTTVFLKGCNLRCFWCHNPETLRREPELQYYPDRCIACGACVVACPEGAHAMVVGPDGTGLHAFDRSRCTACGACVVTCYSRALVMAGERKSAADVVEVVLRDRTYYETSGGGVTVSGGEPLSQVEFTHAILAACRDAGIATAVETASAVPWERFERILPVVDLVMTDVKSLDPGVHRRATGVGNRLILENIRRLADRGVPLIVRTPVVPGVNDTEEAIGAIASFAAELPSLVFYELLRFHMMAASKYAGLGMECQAADLPSPTTERMEALSEAARRAASAVRPIEVRHS